jgi:hypothetical protein
LAASDANRRRQLKLSEGAQHHGRVDQDRHAVAVGAVDRDALIAPAPADDPVRIGKEVAKAVGVLRAIGALTAETEREGRVDPRMIRNTPPPGPLALSPGPEPGESRR